LPAQTMSPQLSRHSGPSRLIIKLRVPRIGAWISDIERARHYAPPVYTSAVSAPPPPQNVPNVQLPQPIELPPVLPIDLIKTDC
jgi:hypothetical protein